MLKESFRHFKPDSTLMPRSERSDVPDKSERTQVVVGPDGNITFVGTPQDAATYVQARRDEGVDVQVEEGGILLPGMTDTHYHPGIYGALEIMHTADISRARSMSEIKGVVQDALRKKADQLKDGEPLLVLDYDSSRVGDFQDCNFNEIEGSRPVFVLDRSYHGGAGNDAAIQLVRQYIEREFPQRVRKNGSYDVPGFLKGQEFTEGYVFLVLDIVESFRTVTEVSETMERQIEMMLMKGVTAIHEMEVISWNEFMAYLLFYKKWQEKAPDLKFPVTRIFLDARVMERYEQEQESLVKNGLIDSEIQKILGLKLLADGSFGCSTALLSDPYAGAIGKHKHGVIFTRIKEAERAMRAASRTGVDKMAVHAIGDAGIARGIQMAQMWHKIGNTKQGLNPNVRFEHFELPSDDSVAHTAKLGAWVSMQSNFGVEDYVYRDRLGGRTRMVCPHADLVNEGVPMMLGSDGMPPSMLYVIWSAMHHPDPKQRLDAISAITAVSASVASYEGNRRGLLQVGAPADIIIASPGLLEALADGKLAEDYYRAADKGGEPEIPIRTKVGELESHIQRVFRQGRMVHNAQKQ